MKTLSEFRARTGWIGDGPGSGALGFGSRILGIFARLGCCGDEDAVVSLVFVLDTRHGREGVFSLPIFAIYFTKGSGCVVGCHDWWIF